MTADLPHVPEAAGEIVIPETTTQAVGRLLCDEAYKWGDRLHDWEHSGADVRESFGQQAARLLRWLVEQGWTPPGEDARP